MEGAAAVEAIRQAQRSLVSRAELSRHPQFSEISPDLGCLDEAALDDLARDSPDEALGLLAAMSSAMDRALRERARSLAGRLVLEVARTGRVGSPRVGRIATVPYRPGEGDLDLDASVDTLVTARAAGTVPDVEELVARTWKRPSTAICLLLDRSGSMTGGPLATNAVAAAAVAWRNPDDFSVVSFARRAIVVKPQDALRPVDDVVDAVLALRGVGTTDLAGALDAARRQLDRSSAGRKITVLLSDCRATESGDVVAAAAALDELVVIAPDGDDDDARRFADRAGARLATVSGPSSVPEAFADLLR